MKLILGLGNPGEKYTATRHNVGFWAIDEIAREFDAEPFTRDPRFQCDTARVRYGNSSLLLAKPQTYMNLSGQALQRLMHFHKIPVTSILILHDDIDLALGTTKFTTTSSSAGHRGVQNIIDILDTKEFSRLRIGVGPRPEQVDASDFVLMKMTTLEQTALQKIRSDILSAVEKFLKT